LEFSDHRSFGEEEEEEVEDFDDDSYKGYDSEEFDESAFDFSTFGEAVDEKDVVVLGAANFTAFVKANKYVLVEFYAPWCGHCKSLLPEWAKAATILKGEVPLVKVDATKHGDLAREYGVEGYPSLFFFVEGAHRPYTGDRTSGDIVAWARKKMGPPVEIIKSVSDAEKLLHVDTPLAIAYVEFLEGRHAEEFTAVASEEDGVLFYMTNDDTIALVFGLEKKTPSVVLLKQEDEKASTFDGTFERKALSNFVSENKIPLVVAFNLETAEWIFQNELIRQVLLLVDPVEYEKIRPAYYEVAKIFRGKILFVLVDLANKEVASPVVDFFMLPADKTSILGFVADEEAHKYLYEGDFSLDSLKNFGDKFLVDDLPLYFKSAPIPEKNDDAVKVVVGHNFDEIVLDDSKDVLLEVYAPWCGHCRALEPVYNELGKVMQNISSIVIAKMDGTQNEHIRVKAEGFPTLLFFPAGKKSENPLSWDAERTVQSFVQLLMKHATIPFTQPEIPERDGGDTDLDGMEGDNEQFDYEKHLGSLPETEISTLSEAELKDEL